MDRLNDFVALLTGHFDNSEQLATLEKEGVKDFPFAEHVNTVCNSKLSGLPKGFQGIFMVEESYYTVGEARRASSHLFLFEEEPDGIRLTSYEVPEGCDKNNFTYEGFSGAEYAQLKRSEKFNPALYVQGRDGVWEGGSVSMFSPVLKFTLFERFSADCLEVSEQMEVNGKRTFGYDRPIIYRRVKNG